MPDIVVEDSEGNPSRSPSHGELLRDLGFPERVVVETVNAASRGLFEFRPTEESVARTMEAVRLVVEGLRRD